LDGGRLHFAKFLKIWGHLVPTEDILFELTHFFKVVRSHLFHGIIGEKIIVKQLIVNLLPLFEFLSFHDALDLYNSEHLIQE
jgi:hypothetical protein